MARSLTCKESLVLGRSKMPALQNTFLFIEPDDNFLNYGSVVLHQIVLANKQPSQLITELMGTDANPDRIKQELSNISPLTVVGIGHGNECYDEETEILTENGWKRFYETETNEKVACLNPETNELEYQLPTAHHHFRYKGKMLRIDGKRISLLVTPNHELYVSWQGRQNGKLGMLPFRFLKAEDIGKNGTILSNWKGFHSTGTTKGHYLKFKQRAKWNCSQMSVFEIPKVEKEYAVPHGGHSDLYLRNELPKSIDIEDWLRFFGIWLAEGSASLGQRKGEYIISITQNDNEKRKVIKKWVDRIAKSVGFSAWEEQSNEHSKAIKFKNKQLYEYLRQFGHSKDKFIPKEIKMLPPSDLQILLDAMVLGDGYVDHHEAVNYATSSKRLADDVQELALKLGRVAIISKDRRTGVFLLRITNSDAGVGKKSINWINYDGEVYCVTVPNHLIYVRRNGRACWCGNSTYTVESMVYLLEAGKPDELALMTNRVVSLCSCLTAVSLGPALINAGAVAYTGYNQDFWFYTGDNAGATRAVQTPFLAEFTFVASLLQGKSTSQARQDQLNAYDAEIAYWTTGDGKNHPDAGELSVMLETNKADSVFLGQGSVQVTTPAPTVLVAGTTSPLLWIGMGVVVTYLIYRELKGKSGSVNSS